MLAQLVSVALTASVKATDTKSVSSFNHFLLDLPKYKLVGLRLMRDVTKKKKGRSDLPWETCRLGRARMFQHQDSPVAIHIRSDLYQFRTNCSLMIKVGHLKTWYKHCVLLK